MLPCSDLTDEAAGVVNASVQALAVEDADLDLDHVEPAGVLGRVVELQPVPDTRLSLTVGGRRRRVGFFLSMKAGANAPPAEWVDKLSCTTRMQVASG